MKTSSRRDDDDRWCGKRRVALHEAPPGEAVAEEHETRHAQRGAPRCRTPACSDRATRTERPARGRPALVHRSPGPGEPPSEATRTARATRTRRRRAGRPLARRYATKRQQKRQCQRERATAGHGEGRGRAPARWRRRRSAGASRDPASHRPAARTRAGWRGQPGEPQPALAARVMSARQGRLAPAEVPGPRPARRPTGGSSALRHFGSVETSLSHFSSRRLRSADEPYFAKS